MPATKKALKSLTGEFMELKLAPKVFDADGRCSCASMVNQIRGQERLVMALCVRDAGMPRKDFIASFPKNETNLTWIDKHIRSKRKHSSALGKLKEEVQRAQKRLQKLEQATSLVDRRHQGNQSRDLARRGASAPREERDGRGELAARDLDREEIHESRPAVLGSDPGRQHRLDESRRQVRVPPRLQVLDLRDLVDSAGDHALDRRPGAHDPHPVHMIETINKLNRISRQMLQEMGREPTPDELAQRMEMPEDKVRKVLKIAKEPISMETPIGDDEDSHLGDFIEDTAVSSPIDSATDEGLKETTHAVLAGLTPREAKVLRMRFGIDMNTDHTLEEVGKQFDVTRERIRQIEAKALRKLRHPSRSDQLRSFLIDD